MTLTDIVIGALVVEAVMAVVLLWIRPGPALSSWYRDLGFSAVAMDVASMSVGTWFGVRLACGANLVTQMVATVVVQLVHDVAFGTLVLPRLPPTRPVRLFRAYAQEKGVRILLDDAIIMILTVLCTRLIQHMPSTRAVIGAIALYVSLLLLIF